MLGAGIRLHRSEHEVIVFTSIIRKHYGDTGGTPVVNCTEKPVSGPEFARSGSCQDLSEELVFRLGSSLDRIHFRY
jgi:hypothetical protein